jgi:hypothetical protein
MKLIDKFNELSPMRKAAVVAATGWNLTLIAAAQRDLHGRSPEEIRGNKRLWQLLCLTNTLGPVSYFRWGRRGEVA